jgi:hypothetical protein
MMIWVRHLHPWGAPFAGVEVRHLHPLVRQLRGVVRRLHPVRHLREARHLHPVRHVHLRHACASQALQPG